MIRILLFFVILAAAAFGFSWLADRPGEIVLTWQKHRIETSLFVALGAVALLTVALIILWSILRFIFRIPTIMSVTARARRTNKGYAAISKGMVAAAVGDAKVTERAAREAAKHLGNVPLANLLQAQSAQISGNRDKAVLAFNHMLEDKDTRVLGLRGLHLEASRNGDGAAAQVFAKEAYALAPLPWAGQALLEHHAMSDDWSGALSVVESSIARKAVGKAEGNRQRGVLKTGIAMNLADREPDEALRTGREAIKLAPDLIPAYVVTGRLLARKGDIRRAGRILEDGWRVKPHPEIARAYLDLRPGDSAADRLSRARTLTKVYGDQPESRLTLARAALEARDFDLARKTMEPLFASNASRASVRACLLMADLEETEHGESGQVREWLSRATRAARDPMWIADGIITDTWAPASPVSGKLDAFVWETPVERLSAPIDPAPKDEIEILPPPIAPAGSDTDAPAATPAATPGEKAAQVVIAASAANAVAAKSGEADKKAAAASKPDDADGKVVGSKTSDDKAASVTEDTQEAKGASAVSSAASEPKPEGETKTIDGEPSSSPAVASSEPAGKSGKPVETKTVASEKPAAATAGKDPVKKELAGPPDDPGPKKA